jgi:osmoprotectant transport system ATP-binding protein
VLEQYDRPSRILGAPATPFVVDFLGPDRAQKRLAVTGIDPSHLEPAPADALPSVPASASLSDALSAMLLNDTERVAVNDGGRSLGVLTVHALMASMRA